MSKDACGLIAQGGCQVPLTGVDVSADIVGRGAKVTAKQTFTNSELQSVEAVYKFPLPENSTICGFRAKIGDREIHGEIEERGKAFEKYDDALMRGDGAYLLDEERPNIFTLSVGNLKAGMTAVIEIDYICLLDTYGTEVRFFLPTTISPRYIPKDITDEHGMPTNERVNPDFALDVPYGLKVAVKIHGKDSISSIESPSHRIISKIESSPVRVEFSSETAAMDRDFVLNILYKKGFESRAYLYTGVHGKFLQVDFSSFQVDQPGMDKQYLATYQKEIIFVLDCSGSMGGQSIEQAKKAIEIFIRGMDEGIKFNIYRFGSTFVKLFESSVHYNSANVRKAIAYIGETDAELGGTELLAPLQDIYLTKVSAGHKRDIIIITDGEIGNEMEIFTLATNDRKSTRVFTVGIGHGPNEYLIKQLARTAYGSAELIAPGERIEPKMLRLFKKVNGASLHDLKIGMSGSLELAPCSPAAHVGDTITLIGRFSSDTAVPAHIKISGQIDSSSHDWTLPVVNVDASNISVPLLWARERIRDLEEGTSHEHTKGSKQEGRKEPDTRKRILDISKTYGIISREASFIAVETRADNDKANDEIVLKRIPVTLTKGWGGVKKNSVASRGSHAPRTMTLHSPKRSEIAPKPNRAQQAFSQALEVAQNFEPLSMLKKRVKGQTRDSKKPIITPEDKVLAILALQRPAGGFDISSDVVNILGISMSKLQMISKAMQISGEGDKDILLNTALMLALLKNKFAAEQELWATVVRKSEDWLRSEVSRLSPTYQEIPLEEWAATYYG